jgi:hypothetical protein
LVLLGRNLANAGQSKKGQNQEKDEPLIHGRRTVTEWGAISPLICPEYM